jgi:hypothetical protein
VANGVITDADGVEHEELGKKFLSELHGYPASQAVQCSYNASFRGAYPGAGWSYDSVNDVFVEPVVAPVIEEEE